MTGRIGIIISRITERLFNNLEQITVDTPFGETVLFTGNIGSREVVGLNRYGSEQSVPSHEINFRANIWALRVMGVHQVISQNAIGSVNPVLRPGDIVIPHDLIDHTKGVRNLSLFDGEKCWVRVDMTEPFCSSIRKILIETGNRLSERIIPQGVFVCAEGPRFETPTEIKILQREGGDIIGTPLIPEAVMAREAELCYASIAPIINYGPGLAPKVIHVGPGGMIDQYYSNGLHELVEDIIAEAIKMMPDHPDCACRHALKGAFQGERPEWLTGTSLDE
jgi:5'-methylthioadenosine phosphorylase